VPDAPAAGGVLDALTPRELQVVELLAAGLDNGTIGRRLGISAKTVRNRVTVIFGKLGVSTRPQAIVWAREAGFGRKLSDASAVADSFSVPRTQGFGRAAPELEAAK
jgi:DNA-binding CsgD family transcriptional regulator